MTPLRTLFYLLILLGTAVSPLDAGTPGPWLPLEVPAGLEATCVTALESAGVTAIGWSDAVVEISGFSGVETVPLATLGTRLTGPDPRWDPWLRSLESLFQPRPGVSRIWVEAQRQDEALRALGGRFGPNRGLSPRSVTGWLVAAFSLLYLLCWLAAGLLSGVGSLAVRKNFRILAVLALAVFGLVLALGVPEAPLLPSTDPGVSWVRHRWFQEAWPEGASWADWAPGKAWSYRSYERREGRLNETSVPLAVPDDAWAQGAFAGLDPHHAARIFGPPNP